MQTFPAHTPKFSDLHLELFPISHSPSHTQNIQTMGCNSSSNLDLSHPEGKTMKAVVFKKYGTPDELCLIDMPVPHSYDTKDQVR